MNNFEYLFYCLKKNIQTKKLKKYYEKNCTKSENNENYVLFAAPFQPEVNTNALVGNSEDVITCLEMISKLIPKDWKIYYKEHFSTFLTNETVAIALTLPSDVVFLLITSDSILTIFSLLANTFLN